MTRPRPLIFVHGQRFAEGRSGLARRTRLMFDILGAIPEWETKVLVSPVYPEVQALASAHGWQLVPLPTFGGSACRSRLRLWALRWWAVFAARWSRYSGDRAVTMLGGADLRITRQLRELLQAHPQAVLWLSRSDLLPLAAERLPGQQVILDANDSVANLNRYYDGRATLRRMAGLSHEALVRRLAAHELRLARYCDLIVAISPHDQRYFAAAGRPCVLEETCILAREMPPPARKPVYDLGFLGGFHDGALRSALRLIEVARDPQLTDCVLAIAGAVCARIDQAICPPNIRLLGRVDDAETFLRSCRKILLWADGETGTSVKFQEAILSGVPVLANAAMARWTLAKPGRHFRLCASLDEAARAVKKPFEPELAELRVCLTAESLRQRVSGWLSPAVG